jgi:hypothetical protein
MLCGMFRMVDHNLAITDIESQLKQKVQGGVGCRKSPLSVGADTESPAAVTFTDATSNAGLLGGGADWDCASINGAVRTPTNSNATPAAATAVARRATWLMAL